MTSIVVRLVSTSRLSPVPPSSIHSTMPATRKSTTASTLKQATLGFQSSKRSGSTSTGKTRRTRSTPVQEVTTIESSSDEVLDQDFDDIELAPSDGEEDDVPKASVSKDEKKSKTPKKPATKSSARSVSLTSSPSFNRAAISQAKPALNIKDVKWNKAYGAARNKSGNLKPSVFFRFTSH